MSRHIVPLTGLGALSLALLLASAGQAQSLVYEAEDYSTPTDGWLLNEDDPGKWKLYTQEEDVEHKRSRGASLVSPIAKEDRATPDDGAPALHTHLTGIPAGSYDVSILNVTRILAISLDGQHWRPYRGGLIARGVSLQDGTYDLWVDDRYAYPDTPGPCYYDAVALTPAVPVVNGIANPGFEVALQEQPAAWTWWSRDGGGSATVATEGPHGGSLAVRIQHEGKRDWAFTCRERLAVRPGWRLTLSGWVKGGGGARLAAVAAHGGKVLTWDCGSAGTGPTTDWTKLTAAVVVPPEADLLYVRWTGAGQTDLMLDDVALSPETEPT